MAPAPSSSSTVNTTTATATATTTSILGNAVHHTGTKDQRVTRSAARLAEGSSSAAATQATSNSTRSSPTTRNKRKAPTEPAAPSADEDTVDPDDHPGRRAKRRRTARHPTPPSANPRSRNTRQSKSMAKPGSSSSTSGEKEKSPPPASESSRRKSSSRNKKSSQESDPSAVTPSPSIIKRPKKHTTKKAEELVVEEPPGSSKSHARKDDDRGKHDDNSEEGQTSSRKANDSNVDEGGGDDRGDPFQRHFMGGGPGGLPASMSSTLRALSGYVSGVSQRLRDILEKIRQKEDASIQLIALQDLSELLLVSNEDNLSGHFSPDQFVKELITLMQPDDFGNENPEMMLMACRCIANLMEALPQSTGNVVYGGAVPILCQKLLEIHFIDLAEQALSTLEKISVEFPSSIVREGGLTACLTYLDFFATSTQRTAVTTAANCCKNIPQDSFPVIRDVMPILLNVLSSSDQKVVEQGSLCVSRVVESFKCQQDKLEELVSVDLLKAIKRLLQPGTTNLIGPSIHTQFLRVLSISAHCSPKLATELLKMMIVETLYQILTGVSPPSTSGDTATQVDGVFIMQALIHRPREQISETLNVICDLLPAVQFESLSFGHDLIDEEMCGHHVSLSRLESSLSDSNKKRLELLKECQEEIKMFAVVLFPTLTDTYSSTVNLGVRQKVLTAQLKMLSNLDISILEEALRNVPYASFLASILSQEDHSSLVTAALKAADLLLNRLHHIYGYQFYREGVMSEISKIASKPVAKREPKAKNPKVESEPQIIPVENTDGLQNDKSDRDEPIVEEEIEVEGVEDRHRDERINDEDVDEEDDVHNEDDDEHDDADEDQDEDDDDDDDDDGEDGGPRVIHEDDSPSPSESSSSEPTFSKSSLQSDHDLNIGRAQRFLEVHETAKSKTMRDQAARILKNLQSLAKKIEECYKDGKASNRKKMFTDLSKHFHGDALNTITSSELLHSDVIETLLHIFNYANDEVRAKARSDFLEVFMISPLSPTSQNSAATPFDVFVHKLQDLLSRAEHFEVVTVHSNALDSNRSSPSSMLAKQLRIRLEGEDETQTPRPFRHQMISIHAIATFKALDDYLRPRMSLDDRAKMPRNREGLSNALAAFAAAAGVPHPQYRLGDRIGAVTNPTPAANSETPTPSLSNNSPANAKGSSSRKILKVRGGPAATANESNPTTPAPKDTSSTSRRSSRRQQRSSNNNVNPNTTTPPPPATAPPPEERAQTPLECADERQLSDDDDIDTTSALDAIVDDLEDGMDSEHASEPTAVNMEVAATGKVTARKDDGTRVATPAQSNTPSTRKDSPTRRSDTSVAAIGGPPSSGTRNMSYVAAIQSVPQDWHLEFSINGKPVSNDMTIYRAVLNLDPSSAHEQSSGNVWSTVHMVKFKKVPGPPPTEPSLSIKKAAQSIGNGFEMPPSLDENPTTSKILRLLNILHEMNTHLDDVLDDEDRSVQLKAEPVSIFVNTKLTAKLNRQLEEPLIVASNCLPSWTQDLTRLYPFLFPFETRHLFLQSTSFGYARSMTRWQNQTAEDTRRDRHRDDRPFQGRLQRQKVRISRARILESAQKVLELYGSSNSILEVEYFGEVGTGLGPTLEFYSTVSKEFSKKKIKMWRENESNESDEYAFGKLGLFPAPMTAGQAESESGKKILLNFKMLGKFIARSMLDSRIIDVSLNPTFFRIGEQPNTVPLSLGAVKSVDADLAKSLKMLKQYASARKTIEQDESMTEKQKIKAIHKISIKGATVEDLGLDFELPGYPSVELIPNGSNIPVTIDNVASYVEKVVDMTLGSGVLRQLDAFRVGFSEAFPYTALKAFTPSELVMLFGRVEEDWSIETLLDSIKADHGFNMDSKSVRNLLQAMSELTPPQRRDFLQFVTGSPKLPIGGFKALTPMFTVVCKPSEPPYTSDDFLISVMTCANYVKLPDYSNIDVLRGRLLTAIQEGQGAFHLS